MRVFCILSDERVFRSKSPLMHNAVLKRRGIDGIYAPFMVAANRLEDAVKGVRALNIEGVNVTVPFKEAVIPYLDELSEVASRVAAVNTIVRRNNRLIGENTDVPGLADALRDAGFDGAGKTALVFGSGGAAKAAAATLNCLNFSRTIMAGRNDGKTKISAARVSAEATTFAELDQLASAANLVVNATTVSAPNEGPETASLVQELKLANCELVVDVNYGRPRNIWEDLALRNGATFMDGLPMLASQAARSFFLWTGMEADAGEFLAALQESL
jgi:shikimate dehydrogenase